jgi:dipeptidyl aminopeptidase/acylaminoacyl peptidase
MKLRILALAAVCAGLLAAKTAPTHESLWLMKRAGAPAVSPNGQWIVFSITEPSYNEADQVSDLWLAPASSQGTPKRLTSTKAGESGVAWSPDSRKIAFSTRREGDEAPQIYVLDLSGGEAQRVTTLSTGATSPLWSPDGKWIAFQSTVFPGAADDEANKKIAAERKARKYNARVYETFPIRSWDRWLDDKQVHLFVMPAEGGKPKDLLAGTKLVTEKGFTGASTTNWYELQPAWTPDSQSLVFVATIERNRAAFADVRTQLYSIPAAGGEPVRITNGNDSYAKPSFSPDGRALYATFNADSDKEYVLDRLAMFSWPAQPLGERTSLTAAFDRSVGSYALAPDGTVYLTAEDAGLEKLYRIAPGTREVVMVTKNQTRGVYGNLGIPSKAAQPFVVATWESSVNPAEAVRINFGGENHDFLTRISVDKAAELDWEPPKHFWFTSKLGRRIHNMVFLPPNFDPNKKYPLFVLIHGGPHSQWRDQISLRWNYHLLTAPGYIVLATNYTGSTGFGEKFAQAIQLDPLKTPGDELNQAADEAIKQFAFIDGAKQCAGGASYGGHLANWLEATTTRYRCLIAHAGLINLESQWGTSDSIYHREVGAGGPPWEQGTVWKTQNPIRYAANFKTPMLLTVGENDFRVPLNQTLENWSALQRMRVPSKLIVFPEENHWVLKGENSKFHLQQMLEWLNKYLGS